MTREEAEEIIDDALRTSVLEFSRAMFDENAIPEQRLQWLKARRQRDKRHLTDALLAAEREARDAKWQPIKTVPRNENVLLWSPDEGGTIYVSSVEDDVEFDPADDPTHWMPLPAPPGREP